LELFCFVEIDTLYLSIIRTVSDSWKAYINAGIRRRRPKLLTMNQTEWYGARTVYKHSLKNNTPESSLYEERIVVLQAQSFNDAIVEAEKEANEYANDKSTARYLGYVNVFKLFDDTIENKTEVYSLMRDSSLDPTDYLNTFFDTGSERTSK